MFSRGEPTFYFFLREAKLTPFFLTTLLPCPSTLSPSIQSSGHSALCAAIPLIFFIQKQTEKLKQKKEKKAKKRNTCGSCPTNPDTPLYWYHTLYFPYFLHYIRGHAGKSSLHRLLIARSQIVS